MDYSISWGYIVKEMEEKFPFRVLQTLTEKIWNKYFDKLYSEEKNSGTTV